MGRDNVLHPRYARLHQTYRTPWLATLLITMLGLLLLFLSSYLSGIKTVIDDSVDVHRLLKARLRHVSSDLVTLIVGVGVLLIWAGFVESFLSQYHEPVLPYSIKIGFGVVEFVLLTLFLGRAGLKEDAA